MTLQLTDSQRKLFDGKNLAYVATVDDKGEPQLTPVWIEYDGTHVLFNTEEKRAKTRHLRTNPAVAVCVADAANPYHYVEVQGKVVEITREGADEMIDRLAKRYIDQDKYPFNKPGDVRLVVKIAPEKVLGIGG